MPSIANEEDSCFIVVMNDYWEFWIDVGGTFTDCYARHSDGTFRRCKILSSGVIKGAVGAGSSKSLIVDAARKADPHNFWRSARLTLFASNGADFGKS